jgi:hypothetical protein
LRQLATPGQRRLALLQGLIRIAKGPQDSGETEAAKHLGMGNVSADYEEPAGAVLLESVEGEALLQVRAGCVKLSTENKALPSVI